MLAENNVLLIVITHNTKLIIIFVIHIQFYCITYINCSKEVKSSKHQIKNLLSQQTCINFKIVFSILFILYLSKLISTHRYIALFGLINVIAIK